MIFIGKNIITHPPFPTQKEATMIEIILFIFELCDVTQYFAQLRSACPAILGWAFIFLFSTKCHGGGGHKACH